MTQDTLKRFSKSHVRTFHAACPACRRSSCGRGGSSQPALVFEEGQGNTPDLDFRLGPRSSGWAGGCGARSSLCKQASGTHKGSQQEVYPLGAVPRGL